MNLIDTYLMMQNITAMGNTAIGSSVPNRLTSTSDALSFRTVLQNVQAKNSSAKTISAGSSMDTLFEEAAEKYNVNANLLKAIGKAESNFKASAISSAGAIGVMQLMPGTARSLGVANPYDARQNIMGGAKYISQLLDKYDGNVKLALAAYNAGPGNVAKYGGIPPFKETQNYVNRVLEYAGQSLSAGGAATSGTSQMTAASSNRTALQSDTIEIKTDTLLTLFALMRAQADLKLSAMLNTQDSSNLFTL